MWTSFQIAKHIIWTKFCKANSLYEQKSPENRINEADFSKFITRNEDNNTVSLGPDGINWSQIDSNFLTIFLDC